MRSGLLLAASIVAFSVAVLAGLVLVFRPYLPASLPLSTSHNPQVTADGKGEPPAPDAVGSRFEALADAKGIAGLTAPQGGNMARVDSPGVETAVVRLSGVQSNSPSYGKPGFHLTLPKAFEQAASGQTVRVTVAARRAPDASGKSFAIAYSTNDVGKSGWQRFDLTDQFASYSFTYQVPVMKAGNDDYIGILPDDGGAVEVIGIGAEIFPTGTALPPARPLAGSTIGTATTTATP